MLCGRASGLEGLIMGLGLEVLCGRAERVNDGMRWTGVVR